MNQAANSIRRHIVPETRPVGLQFTDLFVERLDLALKVLAHTLGFDLHQLINLPGVQEVFLLLSLDNILTEWSSGVGIPVSPPLHPARGPATCPEPNHMSRRFLAGNTHNIV